MPTATASTAAGPLESAVRSGRITAEMTFDQRVWAVCARIPEGRVSTYGRLAAALGQPRAARAVGRALNRNPYAPGVPCHRVVAADGTLGGFATGCDRKQQLLEAEGIRIVAHRIHPFDPITPA